MLLTHRALASEVASLSAWFSAVGESPRPDDVYYSFLPLAHIYGRCAAAWRLRTEGSGGLGRRPARGLSTQAAALAPGPLQPSLPAPNSLQYLTSALSTHQLRGGAVRAGGRSHRLLERRAQGHARRPPRLPGALDVREGAAEGSCLPARVPSTLPALTLLPLHRCWALQPTMFCSVPRVFERFESTTMDKARQGGE